MRANFGPHLALTKPTYKEREGRIWPSRAARPNTAVHLCFWFRGYHFHRHRLMGLCHHLRLCSHCQEIRTPLGSDHNLPMPG